MINIMEVLSEAAARGVEVTIITNAREPVPLTLKWVFEEKWWGAVGKYRACGLDLYVADYDGDRSSWALWQGRTVLAEGEDHGNQPYYHFDACLLAAEAALRAEVRRRRETLLSIKASAP